MLTKFIKQAFLFRDLMEIKLIMAPYLGLPVQDRNQFQEIGKKRLREFVYTSACYGHFYLRRGQIQMKSLHQHFRKCVCTKIIL